jgi:tetratricopeptide (TPR) repeat protein
LTQRRLFELEVKPPEEIIGRDTLLEKLQDLLKISAGERKCNIIGIYGIPGVGKSALASYFASKNQNNSIDFPDGIIALNVNDKDVDTLLGTLSHYLKSQDPETNSLDILNKARTLLRERKILLIFDNVDRAKDIEKIKDLIQGAERSCPVIVTSRKIDLLYDLDISDDGLINVDPLSSPDSLLMLKSLAKTKVKEIEKSLDAAHTITTLLGGLPLALQIASRTLRRRLSISIPNLESYVELLEQAREEWKLSRDLTESEDPNLNLRTSFCLSLKQLKPEEASFFISLSICPLDKFSTEEARAIGKALSLSKEEDVNDCLNHIWDVSLINHHEDSNQYYVHPLIHQFAAEELACDSELKEKVEGQYADYFIQLLNNSPEDKKYEHLDSILRVAKILNDQDRQEYTFTGNILNQLKRKKYDPKYGVKIANEFHVLSERFENWEEFVYFGFQKVDFLIKQGNCSDAITTLNSIESRIKNKTGYLLKCRAILLNRRGGLFRKEKKNLDAAITDFNDSLKIGKDLDLKKHQAIVLNSRGTCFKEKNDLDKAKEDLEKSLAISKSLQQNREIINHIGQVVNSLGRIYQRLGDRNTAKSEEYYDTAMNYLKESCDIRRTQNKGTELANALNSYGQLLCKIQEFSKAEAAFDESIEIEKEKGIDRGLGDCLNNKGKMYFKQGKYPEALETFKESLKFADNKGLAMAHNSLGQIYEKMNDLDSAITEFIKSFEINEKEQINYQQGLQDVTPRLVKALKKRNREQESLKYCERAKEKLPTINIG